jgi:hypothetical protein
MPIGTASRSKLRRCAAQQNSNCRPTLLIARTIEKAPICGHFAARFDVGIYVNRRMLHCIIFNNTLQLRSLVLREAHSSSIEALMSVKWPSVNAAGKMHQLAGAKLHH